LRRTCSGGALDCERLKTLDRPGQAVHPWVSGNSRSMKICDSCRATYPTEYSTCPKDGTTLRFSSELTPGTIVRGKYEVKEKIGTGGMASVYRAQHLAFNEVVAMKVVSQKLMEDEGFLKRFKTEAVVTRKLEHPNAVRVEDFDTLEDGRPFMAMEYVNGRSLRHILVDKKVLPAERAVNIARQACAALAAAHVLGITHRDIKPDNILLVENPDGTDTVKVLDFGIAKIREGSTEFGAGYTPTQTGLVVGTPQYLSPEQAMGKHGAEVDGRADLYALGVVLYEMLTGQLPFHSDTTIGLLMHHIHTVPTPAHYLKPDLNIPPAISLVLMKALEKDPTKRFQTGDEMLTALSAPQNWASTAVMGSESLQSTTVAPPPTPVAPNATVPMPAPQVKTPAAPAPVAAVAAVATPAKEAVPEPEPPPVIEPVRPRPAAATRKKDFNWKPLLVGIAAIVILSLAIGLRSKKAGTAVAPVKPPPPTAAQLEDKRILEEVNRVLDSSSSLRSQEVGVRVENGVVYLNGRVQSKEQSDIAENLTYSVVGVNGIKNNLAVGGARKPEAKPQAAQKAAESEQPESSQLTATAATANTDPAAQQRRISQLLNQAQRQTDMGHYVIARDLYMAVLSMDPGNSQAEEGRKYAHQMISQQRRNR
jgi:serine/threonine protein kinase